jgi:hypothetical protein
MPLPLVAIATTIARQKAVSAVADKAKDAMQSNKASSGASNESSAAAESGQPSGASLFAGIRNATQDKIKSAAATAGSLSDCAKVLTAGGQVRSFFCEQREQDKKQSMIARMGAGMGQSQPSGPAGPSC